RVVGPRIRQCGFHAQPVEDAGEFHGDVAAADNHDALGELGQVDRLVGGDRMLGAGQARRQGRPAAGGDEDLVGREGLVGAHQVDGVGVDQFGAVVDQVGAGVFEVGDVDARQAGDLDVLGVEEP